MTRLPERPPLEVNGQLKDLFDPLCFAVAAAADANEHPDKTTIGNPLTFEFPYDLDVSLSYQSYIQKKVRDQSLFVSWRASREPWAGSSRKFAHAESYLASLNPQAEPASLSSLLMAPIGDYGRDFTEKLLQGTLALSATANQSISAAATTVSEDHRDFLYQYTARAHYDRGLLSTPPALATVHEGILSITQTAAVLTQESVDGYTDDPVRLLGDLATAGLIEKISRISALGTVGPMALTGSFMPGSVQAKPLALSEALERHLIETKTAAIFNNRALAEEYEASAHSRGVHYQSLGRVCPVSGKRGGLQALSQSFARIVAHL